MDLLIIAILLATAILAFVLVQGRDRYTPGGKGSRSLMPTITRNRPSKWPAPTVDPDFKTRLAECPKRKHYRLLNDAEQILFHRLCAALPSMQIFAQVGVAQLAQLRGRQEARRFKQMAGQGVDFVICDADFGIVAAIELAWPTDGGSEKNSPEEEKRRALHGLGIPLIVFRPNDLPDADTLGREVAKAAARRYRLEADRSQAA